MARETSKKSSNKQSYEALMARLEEVVGKLEGGGLSLEDSLAAFEEGVGLVRAGEARLDEAEKKVELLLAGPDAAAPSVKPISMPEIVHASAAPASAPPSAARGSGSGGGGSDDEDSAMPSPLSPPAFRSRE
ncbi:MAG: exodeoxyribonuclease VII small subunit [Myxococcales bacterium]|nr:exodeoxyribonuclease VII small subunit [Myxococcales bacterium]